MFLLFAEDEFYIRQGVLNSIDWPSLGISRVETACDGKAAEELLYLHPDIVLTDIRMPYRNGLELASIAKEADPDCEIIIISSYSDKEYLFKAISLSTVAYIEKPIDVGELTDAVIAAVKRRKEAQLLHRMQQDDKRADVRQWMPDSADENFSHVTRLVLRYLEKHYTDVSLSLDSIAEHAHLNASYLSDTFKKETGLNLKRLITEIRVKKASYLLQTTNLSVADVAIQVGYRNSNYFSRLFRQETGISPHEFRNSGSQESAKK